MTVVPETRRANQIRYLLFLFAKRN